MDAKNLPTDAIEELISQHVDHQDCEDCGDVAHKAARELRALKDSALILRHLMASTRLGRPEHAIVDVDVVRLFPGEPERREKSREWRIVRPDVDGVLPIMRGPIVDGAPVLTDETRKLLGETP